MREQQNTELVQRAYAAFLRGDIQTVLDSLDDNVVWQAVIGAAPTVPTRGERRGKAAVAEFFTQLAATVNFSRFEPREYVAQGDNVVALGHYTATTQVGGSFDSDFVMIFTIRNGRVVQFREFLDVAALNAAFAPKAVLA